MVSLNEQILQHPSGSPEGTVWFSKELLQLVHPNKMSGNIIRALAWIGPEESENLLSGVKSRLTQEDVTELAESRVIAPR